MNHLRFITRRRAFYFLFPLLFLLAACGTFEVGLEREVEPAALPQLTGGDVATATAAAVPTTTTTQEPVTVELASLVEFTNYVHPQLGYQIPVPNGARIEQVENGRQTTFTYSDDSRIFIQQVELFPQIPDQARASAEAFLRWASGEAEAPAVPVTIDNGTHQGASLYALAGTGSWCSEIREQITAFVVQDQGYLIRIRSDAPGHCDAQAVPEAALIIDSVRLPEVVEPSQAEAGELEPPVPAEDRFLQVAYVKNNNLWLWRETGDPVALTKNGGVEALAISDDGQRIAFKRGGNIWVINSDGSGERQLTSETDFENIRLGPDLDPHISSIVTYQMAWQPGSHKLFFNTVPVVELLGLFLTDDLWSVEVDSGEPTLLLPPGEGGKFTLSPDGRALAIVKPGTVHLVDSRGENKQELFTHTPIITYSEFQYYVEPAWQADSQALAVAVPPVDPLASGDQLTSVWYIALDGTSPHLVGNIPAAIMSPALFTAALDRIVYLVGDASSMPAALEVTVSEMGPEGIGQSFTLSAAADGITNWSPGGQHFVFSPPYEGVARRQIAALDGSTVAIGDQESTVFQVTWIDETRYLFLQHDGGRGWALLLGELGSDQAQPIDGIVGDPPAFAVNY